MRQILAKPRARSSQSLPSLAPFASCPSSSRLVLSELFVSQVWVRVTPFLPSTYFPSISPRMVFLMSSLTMAVLKRTPLGALVFTSPEKTPRG